MYSRISILLTYRSYGAGSCGPFIDPAGTAEQDAPPTDWVGAGFGPIANRWRGESRPGGRSYKGWWAGDLYRSTDWIRRAIENLVAIRFFDPTLRLRRVDGAPEVRAHGGWTIARDCGCKSMDRGLLDNRLFPAGRRGKMPRLQVG